MDLPKYKCTILVTGANGQLGQEIQYLSNQYPTFQFIFTTKEGLPIENSELVESFFEKRQIDYCINCAAYTAVDTAEANKEKAFLINGNAVGLLATVCKAHHTKLIHISTDYVYDGHKKSPLKEDNALAPLNIYGWSKLRGEELALNKNADTIIIRTSWVFSSFGNNFVKTMLRLLKEKKEINVVSDQIGSPTYAAGLAQIILFFIQREEEGNHFSGIVNFCNNGFTNWFEFACAIKNSIQSNCIINPISASSYKTAATRPPYSVLDNTKVKALLHITIPDWQHSLQECIKKIT